MTKSTFVKLLTSSRLAHLSIARGILYVFFFVAIGKIGAVLKEIIIADHYGTTNVTDAYLFAVNIITWPAAVWFSVLTIVLVPMVANLRERPNSELRELQGALMGASLILGSSLAVLVFVLPSIFPFNALGLAGPEAVLTKEAIILLIPLIPMGFIISLYSAWLMALGRYANTLLEGVPALTILITVLLIPKPGPLPLIMGTLAGSLLQLIILMLYLIRLGELSWPRWTSAIPEYRSFWRKMGVIIVGQGVISVSAIIDQGMVAHLGTGAIATLGYANRILSVILSLSAVVIARATLPVFSSLRAARDQQLLRVTFYWAAILFLLGMIATLMALWWAPLVVKVIFQRGAFTAADSDAVTRTFRYSAAQLPIYCAGMVLVSQLAASGRYVTLTIINIGNVLVKVIANLLLIPILGVPGVTLATAIMYAGSVLMMLFVSAAPLRVRLEKDSP